MYIIYTVTYYREEHNANSINKCIIFYEIKLNWFKRELQQSVPRALVCNIF